MKTGLVLSGGGARGIAHLGVIKALQEMGIVIDRIAGTSAGAIVGALVAHGYPPDEILKIIETTPLFKHVRPAFTRMGLLRLDKAEELYRQYIPHNSFEALPIPLHVAATDLLAGELIVFESGELIRPVLASCCIPGVFEPYQINKRQYVDGGVLNNLPVECLENKVDFIIGSHCTPFQSSKPISSLKGVLERSLILAIHSKSKDRFAKCHVLIEPTDLNRYDVLDLRKARDLFRIGYEYTLKLEDRLLKSEHEATVD